MILVWDNLPAHDAADYFNDEYPNWFEFHYLPTYSPELNPAEQCRRQMKHVYLCNIVPASEDESKSTV